VKTASIAFCLIFLPIASLPCLAQNPTGGKATRQPTQNERLAKPIEWGEESVRLFTDSNVPMTFKLATSWIPGKDHKGMFRYRISVNPKVPATVAERMKDSELNSPEDIEKFVQRVQGCALFLDLFDTDGFSLRSVYMVFQRVADDQARVIGLTANSSEQMDADEYIKFTGTSIFVTGSWQVKWSCSDKP
jgi:hypothetical protein